MSLHNGYLIALGALFALAFSLMIGAQIRQRRASGERRFSGPGGAVQYLWAMVPVAILGIVGGALVETPKARPPIKSSRIELAVALPVALATAKVAVVERAREPRADGKFTR